jgi:hypothetical protein
LPIGPVEALRGFGVKRLCFLLLCLLVIGGCSSSKGKDGPRARKPKPKTRPIVSVEDCYRVAGRFDALTAFRNPADGKTKLAFGTDTGHLHIMNLGVAGPETEWQSPFLGSPVRGVLVRDFKGAGATEILVYTVGGRMAILEMRDYSVVRENAAFDTGEISCVIAEQLDDDPALELLVCGDDIFLVYDAATLFKEWEATESIPGEWLAIGDADGDGRPDIVLNSGYVLDAQFFRVKNRLGRLGGRVELLDLDGDGVDEIIAERDDGSIAVYDARMAGVRDY